MLRLSQTAVGESVVLAYIEGLREPFTLNADQVIYLSDLGLTSPVIGALLKKAGSTGPAPATTAATTASAAAPAGASSGIAPAPPAAAPASLPVPGAPQPASAAPVYGPAQPTPAAPPAPVGSAPTVVAAPPQAVTYATFYDSLAPYGNWVLVEPYGWCWQPAVVSVTPAWQPYCDGGNWLWTDYGWYWQSTYTWGWAPFHYGRWHRSPRMGWVWAPGYDWGPAWVSWRYSQAYCGWAPLPPECRWSAGVGFSWVSGGVGVSIGFGLFDDCWYACSWNRFRDPHLNRWRLDRPHAQQFVHDSKIAVGGDRSINVAGNNNTVIVNNGLPIDQVQRHSRDEVRKVAVTDAASPEASLRAARSAATSRPEIAAYRPAITPPSERTPAPPASILGRQESRKAPGIAPSSATLPTRPPNSRPSMLTDATAPVPGILGATAPAASRPQGTAPSTLPARTMERSTPGSPTPPSATPAPRVPEAATRPVPSRPPTSFPGANVGMPARPETSPATPPTRSPGTAYPTPARPAPGPMPSPGTTAPVPSRPMTDGPRTAPPRYPGANVGGAVPSSTPATGLVPPRVPVVPSTPTPPARAFGASPRPESMAPSLPPQRTAPPAFTPRPEPRSIAPQPAAPAPPRTFSTPPPGPATAPAPMHRPEAPRPAPGRGGPSER